jgi:hypothetical protein
MGSALALVGGAVYEAMGGSFTAKVLSGIPFACTLAGFGARAWLTRRAVKRAVRFLEPVFGEHAMAVLFRATDEEIKSMAAGDADPQEWVDRRRESLRWQVICRRFEPV